MFLYIVYSVLPWYRSMFPRLSLIHFSLASSHFFYDFLIQCSYFPLLFFTCYLIFVIFKISPFTHFCFAFLSTLGICSTIVSMTATLNCTHCWSTSSAPPDTSNLFLKATRYFSCRWILIEPSQVDVFRCTSDFLVSVWI